MATPSSRPAERAPVRTMVAVVTTGVGGCDRLVLSRVPTPEPGEGEVLVQVLAAGVNNTEINTRLGWYSSSVTAGTDDASEDLTGDASARPDGGWNAATPFPLIQGADCCGRVVAVGPGGDESVLGDRVLVRPCMRTRSFSSWDTVWLGSDVDGAFAQFVAVPAHEAFPVHSHWSDAELATIPCAYGTAENMVGRAGITTGTRVLVTGASGGVGSAVVQLAKRRGAHVIGTAGETKQDRVRALGADEVIGRHEPLDLLGAQSVDVVIDNVAGPGFPGLLGLLVRGGRYVSSGAIGGPLVELDMRTLYLKDLTLIGCTAWDEQVFPDLISYIEREEIRPLLAKVFPLDRIATAQQEFLEKTHVGNFVLVPPQPGPASA
ncbi:zinc-binding dehydrogenase [Kocuria rosea]|nr:zinc-binding dehydrogenase [Kocuria polaris]